MCWRPFYLRLFGKLSALSTGRGRGWIALSLAALAIELMAGTAQTSCASPVNGRLWPGGDPVRRPSLTGVGVATCFAVLPGYLRRWCAPSPEVYRQAQLVNPTDRLYEQTSQWITANTPPDARIAYLEIGRIGFNVDRYIIDTSLGFWLPAGVYDPVVNLSDTCHWA